MGHDVFSGVALVFEMARTDINLKARLVGRVKKWKTIDVVPVYMGEQQINFLLRAF